VEKSSFLIYERQLSDAAHCLVSTGHGRLLVALGWEVTVLG
jgi:hypothetical protein